MKIKYFQDTDTLYIEFRAVEVAETKDLDEDTILDLDHSAISAGSPLSTPANEPTFQHFRTSRLPPDCD